MKPSDASAANRRTLFLSPEPPFPMIGGGPIRSASLFEYLSERSQVDVITFRQSGDSDPRERFPPGRAHHIYVVDLPVHSRSAPARVFRNLKRAVRSRPPLMDRFSGFAGEIGRAIAGQQYGCALIEHFWCAEYEPLLRTHCKQVYLDLHNIESRWHAKLADTEDRASGLIYRRFAQASEKLERELLPQFDTLLVTSAADRERALAIAPEAKCVVYPNALPYLEKPIRSERNSIVFSGNLEYQPNVSAIRYFRKSIWPSVRERCPFLTWVIIGKNPHSIKAIVQGDDRIRLIGPVDDAVVAIAGAAAAVVPLLAGSGTRIKILEAWAAGTAVVSTSIGAEGLEYLSGENLMIADDPSGFSEAVMSLVESGDRRQAIGLSGRTQYEQRYTWSTAFAELDRNLTC